MRWLVGLDFFVGDTTRALYINCFFPEGIGTGKIVGCFTLLDYFDETLFAFLAGHSVRTSLTALLR